MPATRDWWACHTDKETSGKLENARTFLHAQKIFKHKPSRYEVVQYALKMLVKAVDEKQEEMRAEVARKGVKPNV